ncbi:hypothetical protein WR25_23201 [Diploscapter pachys]|uniref:Uncharacterized protein n=1 Tax=Diploscapter pachys TaxID=2018661 RepID=A0A2A2K0F2_9BILA|nr:hypothetical protein WR25_23201 [Diploscapter pachys]
MVSDQSRVYLMIDTIDARMQHGVDYAKWCELIPKLAHFHKKGVFHNVDHGSEEENEWGNSTLPLVPIEAVTGTSITESTTDMIEPEARRRRRRRDIPIDPVRKEPIIFLGGEEPVNSTLFIDDGDFDIVSDHLTEEELAEVKAQIMHTCNALNRESRGREQGKSSNGKKTSRK